MTRALHQNSWIARYLHNIIASCTCSYESTSTLFLYRFKFHSAVISAAAVRCCFIVAVFVVNFHVDDGLTNNNMAKKTKHICTKNINTTQQNKTETKTKERNEQRTANVEPAKVEQDQLTY